MENKETKEMSFEEAITNLEKIVKELESGSCSLDESIKKYTDGMALVKLCSDKLNDATEKINKVLSEDGTLKDFEIPSEE